MQMLSLVVCGAITVGNVIALICGVFQSVFGEEPTQEELERAAMRSLSWPTTRTQ